MPKKTSKKDEGEAPDPPPKPPASLVKLLQKNSHVLKYFQSLQANLDYDVQKWKNRARKHQAESLKWKEKVEHLEKRHIASIANGSESKRDTKASFNTETKQKEIQAEPERKRLKVAPLPVAAASVREKVDEDEDWLDLESSGSDEDDQDFFDEKKNKESRASLPVTQAAPLNILALSSDDSDEEEDDTSMGWLEISRSGKLEKAEDRRPRTEARDAALRNLREAQQLLDRVGVSLVTENLVSVTEKGDDVEDLEELAGDLGPKSVVLERRQDQAVIMDLLQVIKSLVRIRLNYKKGGNHLILYPFMTDRLLPCYMSNESVDAELPNHPAVEGIRSISDALCLMDTYCPTLQDMMLMKDHDFQEGPASEEWCEQLVVGMKDRHLMVQDLLQSLEGELCQLWPTQDRATQLVTTSVHFQPNGDLEGDRECSNSISFGMKNLPRLAALCERCVLARIITRLHDFRQDPKSALQCFWKYLLATTPAMAASPNPVKLPPIQSICVLETLLHGVAGPDSSSPNISVLLFKWMSRVIRLVVDVTATIYAVRSSSSDERIADVANVELRAKARLLENCRFWTEHQESLPATAVERNWKARLDGISTTAAAYIQELRQGKFAVENESIPTLIPLLLELLLILLGDTDYVDKLFLDTLSNSTRGVDWTITQCHLLACVRAKERLEIRHLMAYRQVLGSPSTIVTGGMRPWDYSAAVCKAFCELGEKGVVCSISADFAPFVLSTCMELADGEIAAKVANWLIFHSNTKSTLGTSPGNVLNAMESCGEVVMLRIINLERRPDRLAHFLSQAVHQRVMVMRAVADIRRDCDEKGEHFLGGRYAFDGGQGRPAEVELRLSQQVGCNDQEELNNFVESHWRPNDLQVFDTEAPESLDLVRISSSEKACALSHIASWRGVIRSLQLSPAQTPGDAGGKIFRENYFPCAVPKTHLTIFIHRCDIQRRSTFEQAVSYCWICPRSSAVSRK